MAVALDVRKTIRLGGIRPPIVAVGIIIMNARRTGRSLGLRDAERRKEQGGISSL